MPFDPLWQLSEKLISYHEFDSGERDSVTQKPRFAWRDTLDSYLRQDTLQRLEQMYDRMRLLEGGNPLVNYALELAHSNIFTIKLQRIISSFNYANVHFDRGILSINNFIRYRNASFQPVKPDAEIWQMITDAETEIQLADSAINTISETPEKYRNDILYQKQLIIEASTRIYKERLFLQHYFETPVKKRKMLFLAAIRSNRDFYPVICFFN